MIINALLTLLLDSSGHPTVEEASAGVENTLVGHIAQQGVAKYIGQGAVELVGLDEINRDQAL